MLRAIKQQFANVCTLRDFLIQAGYSPEDLLADCRLRARMQQTLEYQVAYDAYEVAEVKEVPEVPEIVNNLKLPSSNYYQWLRYTLGITSTGPRPVALTLLASEVWGTIDQLVGRRTMHFLICYTSIFAPQPNSIDSYLQITGQALKLATPRRDALMHPETVPYIQKCTNPKLSPERAKFTATTICELSAIYPSPPRKWKQWMNPLKQILSQTSEGLAANVVGRNLPKLRRTGRDHMVPHNEVVQYCMRCLRALIPRSLLGPCNWAILERKIRYYIGTSRYSKYCMPSIISGFKQTQAWLGHSSNATEAQHKQDCFNRLIFWIFVLVQDVLLAPFTVRQTNPWASKCCFYVVHHWIGIENRQNEKLAQVLEEVPYTASNAASSVPSYVIPKPKDGEFRHLVNLKAFKAKLTPINQVLKWHTERSLEIPRLSTPTDVYPVLDQFLQNHQGKQFYVVRTDIKGCYDNANTRKLLEILDKTLVHDTYQIRAATATKCVSSQVMSTALHRAAQPMPAGQVFQGLYRTLLVERPRDAQLVSCNAVKQSLAQLLQHLLIRVGNKTYRKFHGIPQGSSVSVALCDLLCQDMIRHSLQPFWASGDVLLLRYVDDFLFISTDRRKSIRYRQVIEQNHPEHGIFYSKEKTRTNFGPGKVGSMNFLGIALALGGRQVHVRPSIGLESLLSCLRAHRDWLDGDGQFPRHVKLSMVPRDASLQFMSRPHPTTPFVDIRRIINHKLSKLCVALRSFARHRVVLRDAYIRDVIRDAIKQLCSIFFVLGVDFKHSRRFIVPFLKRLLGRANLRRGGLVRYGVKVWISVYKNKLD